MKIRKGVKSYNISNNSIIDNSDNKGEKMTNSKFNENNISSLKIQMDSKQYSDVRYNSGNSNNVNRENIENNGYDYEANIANNSRKLNTLNNNKFNSKNNKNNGNFINTSLISAKSGNSNRSSLEKEKANVSITSISNDGHYIMGNINDNLNGNIKNKENDKIINIKNLNLEKLQQQNINLNQYNNTINHNSSINGNHFSKISNKYHNIPNMQNMSEMEKYVNYVNNSQKKSTSPKSNESQFNNQTISIHPLNDEFWDDNKFSLSNTINFNTTLKEKFSNYLKTNNSLIKTTDIENTITKTQNHSDNIYSRILKTNMNYKSYYRVKEAPYKSKLKSLSLSRAQNNNSNPSTSKDSNYIALYEKGLLKSKMRSLIYENAKYNNEQKELKKCTFQPVITQTNKSQSVVNLKNDDFGMKNGDIYVRNQDWLNIKKIKYANLRIKYTNKEYTFKPVITSINKDKECRNKNKIKTNFDSSTILYFERLKSVFNKKSSNNEIYTNNINKDKNSVRF